MGVGAAAAAVAKEVAAAGDMAVRAGAGARGVQPFRAVGEVEARVAVEKFQNRC